MTRNSFHFQINRCSEIASEWKMQNPEMNLVNATEGGAFIDGFDHMSLQEFAKSRNLAKCLNIKKITFTDKTPVTDSDIKGYLNRLKDTMDRTINVANTITKLDCQTDRSWAEEKNTKSSSKIPNIQRQHKPHTNCHARQHCESHRHFRK